MVRGSIRIMSRFSFAVALALSTLGLGSLACADPKAAGSCERQTLFAAGQYGYHCYRIPALLTTTRGTILAFCEARKNSCSDHGDVDLVLRRSTDGGRSWSEMQVIADEGGHTMGNPCPVVDRTDGTVWLPLCRDNKRILIAKSTDDGKSWTKTVDITRVATDPGFHWVGTGPGHGIQLSSGRLLIPCWADTTPRLGEIQLSYVFYSDDHGKTWQLGGKLDANASDECEIVELADGTLYMNMRSRQGKKQRAFAQSDDRGAGWTPVRYDPRLPEPSCQGSILRCTDGSRTFVLLACVAEPSRRARLTVRASYDSCGTWPVAKVIHAGSSAYCDLAQAHDSTILLLYEADDYSKIVLCRFLHQWLTDDREGSPE